MKRLSLLPGALIAIIIFCGISREEARASLESDKAFNEANHYYASGLYDRAIEEYESILRGGLKSGNLYYNLGNSYFKKGRLGKALLYYEKARGLIPRDRDLLFNYKHAKSLIKQKLFTRRMLFIEYLNYIFDYFTLRELAIFASGLYYLTALSLIISIFFNQARRHLIHLSIILSITLAIISAVLYNKIEDMNRGAIATAAIEDAKFGPFEKAEANFPVYEGTKVYVLERRGDWYKIKIASGQIGWMRKETIESMKNNDDHYRNSCLQ